MLSPVEAPGLGSTEYRGFMQAAGHAGVPWLSALTGPSRAPALQLMLSGLMIQIAVSRPHHRALWYFKNFHPQVSICFKETHVSGVAHTDVLTAPPGLAENPATSLIFSHFEVCEVLFACFK